MNKHHSFGLDKKHPQGAFAPPCSKRPNKLDAVNYLLVISSCSSAVLFRFARLSHPPRADAGLDWLEISAGVARDAGASPPGVLFSRMEDKQKNGYASQDNQQPKIRKSSRIIFIMVMTHRSSHAGVIARLFLTAMASRQIMCV